jgi:hypothetical protein
MSWFKLDQSRDVLAIPADLIQQGTDVRVWSYQHNQDGVGVEDRNDGQAGLMFEDDRIQFSTGDGPTELFGWSDDRGDQSGEPFGINTGRTLRIDEEAVTSEYHSGIHTVPLANCAHKVSYARHSNSKAESAAKLKDEVSEVKR